MLALALPFLRTNWKLIAAALLIISALTWQRHQGAESVRKEDRKAEAKAVAKAAVVTADLASSARKAGDDASASRERIVYRTRTIVERIPYEIPRSSDVRLSPKWLSEYNASLGLPEGGGSSGQPADAAGSLYSADALAQAIVPNNGACSWYAENYPKLLKLYDEAHDAVNGFKP